MSYGLPEHGDLDWDGDVNNSVEALYADVQTAKANALAARNDAAYVRNVVDETGIPDIAGAIETVEAGADSATASAGIATGAASSAQSYAGQAATARTAAEDARDDAIAARIMVEGAANTTDAITTALLQNSSSTTAAAVATSITVQAITKVAAAVGNSTTDAAVLTAAIAAGNVTRADGGTYLVGQSGVSVSASKSLEIAAGSKVKIADSALTTTAGTHRALRLFDGSRFIGEVDGNRDGQSRSAYNTAGGGPAGILNHGIVALGSAGTPLRGIYVDATVRNVIDQPLLFQYVEDSYIRIRTVDCGGPVVLSNCRNVTIDYVGENTDNRDWLTTAPHAIDFQSCTDIRSPQIVIRNQSGTGSIGAGTAQSDYVSGLTMFDCNDILIDKLDCEFTTTSGQSLSVGVSILGTRNLHCAITRIVGYNDVLLELGGVIDSSFAGLDLDGGYAINGAATASGRGIAGYNNALRGDFKGRTWEYTRNVKFTGGHVRRCLGHALDLWAAVNTVWMGVQFTASHLGLYAKYRVPANMTGQGPAIVAGTINGHRWFGCDFTYNENSGAEIWDLIDGAFHGCRFNNNGQGYSYGSVRSSTAGDAADSTAAGIKCLTNSNKTGLRLVDCEYDDTQSAATGYGYYDPSAPTVLAMPRVELYGTGQTLAAVGGGVAAADVKVRVDAITKDTLIIAPALTTLPTVSGTGTIATSGTAVTGVSTAFNTELTARAYIKVGSESRRITKVASNTGATLESAFTTNVTAGTSFSIHRISLTGLPSQKYGRTFTADTISPILIGARDPSGNVTSGTSDSTSIATPMRRMATDVDLANLTQLQTAGEGVMPRTLIQNNTTSLSTQGMRLTFFTAQKTEAITQVRVPTGGTAAAATPTLVRFGIYSVASNGDLTLVASTPNDTTLLAAASTDYTKSLSATFNKVAGTRYAFGFLVVSSATMPTLHGAAWSGSGAEAAKAPRLTGLVSSQSDLPSTVLAGSVSATTLAPYAVLVP